MAIEFRCAKCNLRKPMNELSPAVKDYIKKHGKQPDELVCEKCLPVRDLEKYDAIARAKRLPMRHVPPSEVREDQLVTVQEAQKILNVRSPQTVYRYSKEGLLTMHQLPTVRPVYVTATGEKRTWVQAFRRSEVEALRDMLWSDAERMQRSDKRTSTLVRERMEETGISRSALAALLHISTATLDRLLKNQRTPNEVRARARAWVTGTLQAPGVTNSIKGNTQVGDEIVPKQDVVVRHPAGSSGAPPWAKDLRSRVEALEADLRARDKQLQAVRDWVAEWMPEAPDWRGWKDLLNALGEQA